MNWITDLQDLGLVVLAGGLGAAIGFERETSDKPAGLRTHIFVCAGSALLMLLGDAVVGSFDSETSSAVQADPIRVIQAIVVGISFLGAGTIIHRGGQGVEGLTTAASIFLTAGIGIAVAAERYLLSIGTTLFSVLVLTLLGRVERRLNPKREPPSNSDAE